MGWIHILLLFIRGILRDRTELASENLALRQQLAVLERTSQCPRARQTQKSLTGIELARTGKRIRTADVQLGKPNFYGC